MDFSKLLAKASSNAASSRSKVEEAMKEIDAQRQKRAVQLRGQHKGQPKVGNLKRQLNVPVLAGVVPLNGNKVLRNEAVSNSSGLRNNRFQQSKAAPMKKPVVAGSCVSPTNASGKAKPAAPADTYTAYTVSARQSFYHLMQKAENNVSTLPRPKSKSSRTIDSSAAEWIGGGNKGPSVGLNGFSQHQSSAGPGRKEAPPPLGISANLDLTSTSARRRKKADPVKPARQQPPSRHGTGHKNSSLPRNQAKNDEVTIGVTFETTKERRFLPGDLRYKPPTEADRDSGRQASIPPRNQSKQAPPPSKMSRKTKPQQGGPPLKRRRLTETPPPQSRISSKAGNERGPGGRPTTAAEIERRQLEKELEELDRLKAERMAKLKRMRETTNCRANGQRVPPPPPVKRQPLPISSSSTRPKPQWAHHHHHSSHNYTARSIRIEDEEEYNEDDDEYDSDLADFIDDSDLGTDEVGRSEMEAALKLLNPKYDTKKWKEREREINISRMQSSHRDIEKEEAVSRRLGLYEDLREAQRGSQRIKE